MKKLLILFVLAAGLPFLLSAGVLRTKYADLVNPMVGTDFHGHRLVKIKNMTYHPNGITNRWHSEEYPCEIDY